MKKIQDVIDETAITQNNTRLVSGYDLVSNPFWQQLNEAIDAADLKKFSFQEHDSEILNYSKNLVNQLVSSVNFINTSLIHSTQTSGEKVNLYIAQERKDEKSGRGRLILH